MPLFIILMVYNIKYILFLQLMFLTCNVKNNVFSGKNKNKITFDLKKLNQKAVFLDYEFCVPQKDKIIKELKTIDQTIIVYKTSKGRIGCSNNQYLCIGNSNQKNAKKVLLTLASFDYIQQIDQCFFE